MIDGEKYWVVEFCAGAFEDQEQADAFRVALEDLFMDMELAKDIAASSRVVEREE